MDAAIQLQRHECPFAHLKPVLHRVISWVQLDAWIYAERVEDLPCLPRRWNPTKRIACLLWNREFTQHDMPNCHLTLDNLSLEAKHLGLIQIASSYISLHAVSSIDWMAQHAMILRPLVEQQHCQRSHQQSLGCCTSKHCISLTSMHPTGCALSAIQSTLRTTPGICRCYQLREGVSPKCHSLHPSGQGYRGMSESKHKPLPSRVQGGTSKQAVQTAGCPQVGFHARGIATELACNVAENLVANCPSFLQDKGILNSGRISCALREAKNLHQCGHR